MSDTHRFEVGKRLREARERRFSSAAEAARALGVKAVTWRSYENGQNMPPHEIVVRAAKAFGTTAEWIISGGSEPVEAKDRPVIRRKDVVIPEIDVQAAAGGGQIVGAENVSEFWTFPDSFVRSTLGAGRADLHIVTIIGDSMVSDPPKPRDLHPGDKVIVNIASNSPSPAGTFIVDDGVGLVAKRVELVPRSDPPRIRLTSNNPIYSSYEVELSEARIIGRVVMRLERM